MTWCGPGPAFPHICHSPPLCLPDSQFLELLQATASGPVGPCSVLRGASRAVPSTLPSQLQLLGDTPHLSQELRCLEMEEGRLLSPLSVAGRISICPVHPDKGARLCQVCLYLQK